MSYNSKAYLAYQAMQQEPDLTIKGGKRRNSEDSAMADRNRFFASLSYDQLAQLKQDAEDNQRRWEEAHSDD